MTSCGLHVACVCLCKAEQLSRGQPSTEVPIEDNTKPVTLSTSMNTSSDDVTSLASSQTAKVPPAKQSIAPRASLRPCPYKVIEICNHCWTRSKEVVTKSDKTSQCRKVLQKCVSHIQMGISVVFFVCYLFATNVFYSIIFF